jgi:hypothetical protein
VLLGRTLTRLNWFREDNKRNDLHEQRNDYPNIGDCAKHSNNNSSQCCGCSQVSIKAKLRETAQEVALVAVAAVILVVLRYTSYIDKRNRHR